ncbi:MAG: DUF58 domain-containing protein [Planctomycetia bacterium]|nr:DUF58 domain-containing protein [Planctomycetia bacterium]
MPAVALAAAALFLRDVTSLLYGIAIAQAAAVVFAARRQQRAGARAAETGVPRVTPTLLGRIALPSTWVLVIVAVLTHEPVLRWWACVLFGLTLSAWPLVRWNLARVEVARATDRRARVDAPCGLELRVEHRGRGTARGLVVDDRVGPWTRPVALQALFDRVPGRGSVTARTTVVMERRGWKRFRPVRLSTRFPLGFFEASVDLAAPCEVLVRPREGRPTPALLARLRGATVEQASSNTQLGTDEFHGLRAWRLGDDPRRIHWRTSARRGIVTYVERRDEGFGDVVVALARCPARGPEADRRFEAAVSIAATVVRAALRDRLRVRLVLGEPGAPTPRRVRGRGGLELALDALSEVKADGARRPLAALTALLRRGPATVVWVCASAEATLPETLADAGAPDALVLAADAPALARHVRGIR